MKILSPRALLLLVPLTLAIIIACAWVGTQLFQFGLIKLTLHEQNMKVRFPPQLNASLETTRPLDIQLDGDISTVVPFKEVLEVPFKGEFPVNVKLDANIPVAFEVVYEGIIPVDTMAAITATTEINFGNVKKLRNLRISTSIPMKFDLPVNLRVPVKDNIRFNYHGPITVFADEMLKLPVDTIIETTIKVDQRVSTPVTSRLNLAAELPQTEVSATITHSELNLRPATLQLLRKEAK